jgi:hypothetical protein
MGLFIIAATLLLPKGLIGLIASLAKRGGSAT